MDFLWNEFWEAVEFVQSITVDPNAWAADFVRPMVGVLTLAEQVAIPGLEGIDEEDLLEELEELGKAKEQEKDVEAEEEAKLVAELAALGQPTPSFPRAPRQDPMAQRRQEQEREELAELDRLQAAMKVEQGGGMAMLGSSSMMVPVA